MRIRRWIQNRRLGKAIRQIAHEKYGNKEMTLAQYKTVLKGSTDNRNIEELRVQLETAPGLYGGIKDWDWDAILKWVRENFIPMILALIPIILMFLEKDASRK